MLPEENVHASGRELKHIGICLAVWGRFSELSEAETQISGAYQRRMKSLAEAPPTEISFLCSYLLRRAARLLEISVATGKTPSALNDILCFPITYFSRSFEVPIHCYHTLYVFSQQSHPLHNGSMINLRTKIGLARVKMVSFREPAGNPDFWVEGIRGRI
jgi:hypothetical protein